MKKEFTKQFLLKKTIRSFFEGNNKTFLQLSLLNTYCCKNNDKITRQELVDELQRQNIKEQDFYNEVAKAVTKDFYSDPNDLLDFPGDYNITKNLCKNILHKDILQDVVLLKTIQDAFSKDIEEVIGWKKYNEAIKDFSNYHFTSVYNTRNKIEKNIMSIFTKNKKDNKKDKNNIIDFLQGYIKTFNQDKRYLCKNYLKFIKQDGGVIARIYNNEALDIIEVDISDFIDKSPIVEGFYKGNENETIIFSLINNNFSQYDKTKMKNHIAQADELFDFAMLEDDGSEEYNEKQNEPQAVENIKAPQEQNEEELKLKKVLIKKNKLLIEVEQSEIKNERGCAGLVSVSRLYINGKLYIDADGVDTFYEVYTWGRNGVVEVNLKYTQEHHPDFKQVVLDQFDLKSYVGLKCKKSKSRLFNEWSKEIHENEKSKHFANISWKVFEKYNHLFSRVTLETTDNRAKKVKAVTTCEVEKALCDLVLLYTQSYHDKFIISDWYNRVDVVLKNLELAKTNTKEVLEEEIDNNNENEPVIKNNIIETDDKIIYDDAEEPELESNATQQANFTEAEVKQLKELYDLKNTMLEKIKNEPVTDETIKNLQSIIDEIDPEATINDEIIIQDEFISVLNYAIAKKQQAVENQKSANQKREGKSSVEQQKHKKSNRLLLTKKDEAIMYLKQDFNKYIKKVHTRLREQEDFVKTMCQINPYCDKKYIGKNLRKKIGFLLRLEVILLANTRYNNSY